MQRLQGRLQVLFSRSETVETQVKHQHFLLDSPSEHLLLMCWTVRMDIQTIQGLSVPSSHSGGASVSLGDLPFWPWHLHCNNYAFIFLIFVQRDTWPDKCWLKKKKQLWQLRSKQKEILSIMPYLVRWFLRHLKEFYLQIYLSCIVHNNIPLLLFYYTIALSGPLQKIYSGW